MDERITRVDRLIVSNVGFVFPSNNLRFHPASLIFHHILLKFECGLEGSGKNSPILLSGYALIGLGLVGRIPREKLLSSSASQNRRLISIRNRSHDGEED